PTDAHTARHYQPADWAVSRALVAIAPGSASAGAVITVLTEVVRSGPPNTQGPAAWVLGQFGPAAEPAIPALIRMVREAGPPADGIAKEQNAALALGLIAQDTPSADEAVTVLAGVLDSKWPGSRAAALKSLLGFGPKAAIAIARIRELCEDEDREVR